MKAGAPLTMAIVLACTCAAAPRSAPAPASAPTPAPAAKAAVQTEVCGAGRLPRVTEKSFAEGGLAAFLAGTARGTVAVAWDGTRARVIDRCRLDGRYTEAKGKGAWRFRATNRVLLRTDEIAGECRTATHLVAAYVTRHAAPAASQMNGILVPLPCPSASDPDPAPGCIARGLTGPARRKKAEAIMVELPLDRLTNADAARLLEVFVLVPDKHWGVTYAAHLNTGDCAFFEQGQWLGSQYETISTDDMAEFPAVVRLLGAPRRPAPPQLNWQVSNLSCIYRPVFLQCFPGQFDPIFFDVGYWSPVEPGMP